ncbi:hypothetical protein [Sphingomonas sp.]|uniref:hypothetical protein n=1 Tax=Sphingomonas sp. TaxID=28214 RepID=UPI001ED255F2|nr:hypothetical protein [Sphingomonas sp.]MBX3594132.1 hypothetical protein [Sphingomonas sp.]
MSSQLISAGLAVAGPILLSSFVGAVSGLWVFRQQNKERLCAAVTWEWRQGYNGEMDEEPYLAIQNTSSMPSYLVGARIMKGYLWRSQVAKYAFDYPEVTDGNFPLQLKPASVTSFPLAKYRFDNEAAKASRWTQLLGRLGRNYFWIEVRTLAGRKLTVGANDATSFQKRPKWLGKG